MPKYTADNGDWVEISGAAKLSMRKLDGLYSGSRDSMFALAQSIIVASAFHCFNDGDSLLDVNMVDAGKQTFTGPLSKTPEKGLPENSRTFDNMLALTLQQWDWLRERIFQAAREEVLDPQL